VKAVITNPTAKILNKDRAIFVAPLVSVLAGLNPDVLAVGVGVDPAVGVGVGVDLGVGVGVGVGNGKYTLPFVTLSAILKLHPLKAPLKTGANWQPKVRPNVY